ncbi:Proteophosphoglycan ppg4 [Rhodotorula toruloides ATCC 204091]|nr:Proteophosphoglycan ppg4 [Rhodotorula toruloides ATCC 204091]
MKTARKPQRVLRSGGAESGGAGAAGPSTQQQPTTNLSSSSHLGVSSASTPLSTSTSSTALRPLPPNVAATPSRARRLITPTSSREAPDTFKEPPTPSTVRPRTRIVSSSSTSAGTSAQQAPSTLSRSLSKSTSSSTMLDSPRTVKPATRTLPKPPETTRKPSAPTAEEKGKKATLSGLGRPTAREPSATSATSSRRRSSTGGRSVSAASTTSVQQTPLRQSTRTPSSSLAVSQTAKRPPRPPAATTASTNRTLPASRRLGQAQSAIPVATASIAGGRTLRRPDSALSSTSSATLRKDPPSRPSSRTAAASEKAAVIRPRESLAASQTSRKSSWETVGSSARPSLSGRDEMSQRTGGADQTWETDRAGRAGATGANAFDDASYATPRKPSAAPAPGMILSPPSPDSSPTADLSTDDPNLSHFSHASFLSPLPSAPTDQSPTLSLPKPPPLPLARTLARTRSKPRESASLEDILRLGLLNSQMRRGSMLGPAGGGGDELELLLDEGSSRLMSEELASSIGAGDGDFGSEAPEGEKRAKKDSPLTPWRGRVVSLSGSMSARKASSPGAASGSGLLASPSAGSDAGQGGGKVLLLRQSTTEASDLRRQVASLLAEVEQLKRGQAGREVVREEAEGERERVKELRQELEAAREREDELRRDWEEERRAMEEDLAELAAAAVVSPTTSALAATPSPNDSALSPSLSAMNRSLALSLQLSDTLCAHRQTSTLYDAVQARAKMEREEVKGSLEALRVIAAGLRAWEGGLQVA